MGLFSFLFGNKKDESADFKKMVTDGAILLDVRTPEEFAAGHIEGAKNIPVQVIHDHIAEIKAYNKPIVAYCRSGRRSGNATNILVKKGLSCVNGGGFEALQALLK